MNTTQFGYQLLTILSESNSIRRLIEFIRDSKYFTNCQPINKYKFGYIYQIPLNLWMTSTGIDPHTLPLRHDISDYQDGSIWIDHNFERDAEYNGFQDDDGPMFVYIGIDNYSKEFDEEE